MVSHGHKALSWADSLGLGPSALAIETSLIQNCPALATHRESDILLGSVGEASVFHLAPFIRDQPEWALIDTKLDRLQKIEEILSRKRPDR